jgi:signal-transduction protein with cAMP-binding, CBS, and nucleotidyltransferase domain
MKKKEINAIFGTLFFLILAIILFYIVKVVFDVTDDNISFTALIIFPILVYLILSGRIKAFKAGGVEATFNEIANKSVEFEPQEIVESSSDEIGIIEKGTMSDLRNQLDYLNRMEESKKFILTFLSGKQGYYDQWAVGRYLESLSGFRNFKFAVILDKNKKVVAYSTIDSLFKIVKRDNFGNELIQLINDGDNREIRNFPGFITKTISDKSKNIEALKIMEELNMDDLIMVNESNELKGIVNRNKILSKLMIALSE